MKRIILFSFLIFLTLGLSAQVVVSPDSLSANAPSDTSEIELGFAVTIQGNASVSVWWQLIKEDFPKEWKTQVCDVNTCYFENFDACPATNPNQMESDSTYTNFSIKIKPNNVDGSTLMHFKLYSDSEFVNELASIPVHVTFGTVSSSRVPFDADITLYPNPTIDKFMLNNSSGIQKLEIYNIAGKKMKSFNVVAGKEYDVDELKDGLYLVRFIDRNDKVKQVSRLSKR